MSIVIGKKSMGNINRDENAKKELKIKARDKNK